MKTLFLGDFNMAIKNANLNDMMNNFSLENLIKEDTCYKLNTSTCIYLILPSQRRLFMK